jgi:ring-1,2-phenylacetyl-CoA epoxidase subunit PaaD
MEPAAMLEKQIWERLRDVRDPELPISIVDLGIVESCKVTDDGRQIEVLLTATRSSCPAKQQIAEQVERTLKEAFPELDVVCFWHDAATWNPSRISEKGRRILAEFGYGVEGVGHDRAVCPHCAKPSLVREGRFGSSPCLSFYFCSSCQRPYELVRWQGLE